MLELASPTFCIVGTFRSDSIWSAFDEFFYGSNLKTFFLLRNLDRNLIARSGEWNKSYKAIYAGDAIAAEDDFFNLI